MKYASKGQGPEEASPPPGALSKCLRVVHTMLTLACSNSIPCPLQSDKDKTMYAEVPNQLPVLRIQRKGGEGKAQERWFHFCTFEHAPVSW